MMPVLKLFLFISVFCVLVNFHATMEIPGLYYKSWATSKNNHLLTKRSSGIGEWWSSTRNKIICRVGKLLPFNVQNFLHKREIENQKNITEDDPCFDNEEKLKEHGSLDFFGRDIIRQAGKTIEEVSSNVGSTIKNVSSSIGINLSNRSGGLDTDSTFFSGIADKFREKVQAIHPGTKWCGDGNKSRSYDDLGTFSKTDACCREHDLCPISIPAGETKYNLVNTGLFTRSHCDCDTKFYKCLKQAGDIVSRNIGVTYFTVLGPQCFKEERPIKGCANFVSGKCVEYKFKRSSERRYQWFDSPTF